jgi:hypothetical protein
MLVGVARETINPELGQCLCGYGCRPCTGIHDDLSVTALYLADGSREALLLVYDLIGLRASTQEIVRRAVARETGVKAGGVFLACTHVHSAPDPLDRLPVTDEPNPDCRADYLGRLPGGSARAAVRAKAGAEDCELRYNFADVAENMNRRFTFPDRRYLYIPDNKQLVGQSREYVDRELGIVAFRKRGTPNRYKAVLTNYTCHPLCVGNSSNLATADYQGVLRRRVEETFEGCLCVATTGAAGDNHPLMPEGGFATAEAMGTILARHAILRCYDSVSADYDAALRLAWRKVKVPFKDEATRAMLPEGASRRRPLPTKRKDCEVAVSLLGIGPILFAGFPGEPMAELGAMLKWSSPFLKSYVLFTATECLGYFPTANQFYWGGYEANSTGFACGTGERLVGGVLDAARGLLRKQPLRLPPLDATATNGLPK